MKFKKPLLLLGQGADGSDYRKFAEKYQIPILTTRLGVHLIEYDHPLYVGHPGNYGDIPSKKAIDNADLIISVGCRLASAVVGYHPEEWGPKAYKVVVDIDEKELDKPGPILDMKVLMTAKLFFESPDLAGVHPFVQPGDTSKWVKQCQEWKENFPSVTDEHRETLNSYHFMEKLSEEADAKDIVIVDTGSCFHTATQAWKVKKGQRFLTTGGLSSMGWWAASLGGGILGRTICITGDGSFQMNIQELATIKHNSLPIKIFVISNEGYGLIRNTQKRFMNGRLIGESPRTGVWCPGLGGIARAYGIDYVRIKNIKNLSGKLKGVLSPLARNYPTICEIMVPKWEKLLRPSDVA